jgi:hypothetical protein
VIHSGIGASWRHLLFAGLLAACGAAAAAGDSPAAETPSTTGSDTAPAATADQTSIEASAPDGAQSAAGGGSASAPAAKREPVRLEPARPSLPSLANKPGWSDLSAAQKQVLAPFEAQWQELPLNEKRAWADLARRFPQMDAQEQARVQRRIGEWAGLTPDQRKLARANYRMVQQTGLSDLQADWARYQSMTPEQRAVLGTAGSTSNTAARHAGAPTGLAKEAAQPLSGRSRTGIAAEPGSPGAAAKGVAPTVGSGTTSSR